MSLPSSVVRLLCCLAFFAAARALADPADIPVRGREVPLLARWDDEMRNFMDANGISAGTFTMMRNTRVIFHHAYGWSNRTKTRALRENALMRIASCTKPFTAAAIHESIREGRLALSDRVFALNGNGGVLNITPFGTPDARLQNITIEHLLQHLGGWDRDAEGVSDLTREERTIANALGVRCPPTREETVRWIMGQPLQFNPGGPVDPNDPTILSAYSNVGYLLLGLVIEEVSGQDYLRYLHERVILPSGSKTTTRFLLGRTRKINNFALEPYYDAPTLKPNVYYPAADPREEIEEPYGSWSHEARTSQGRVVTDGVTMVRHMERYIVAGDDIGALRGPGVASKRNHGGSLPGTNSMMRVRDDGVSFAFIFNKRREETEGNDTGFSSEFRDLIDGILDRGEITAWPTTDVTASTPPTVQTLPASDLDFYAAKLNARIATDNVDTQIVFDYGTSAQTLTKSTPPQMVTGTYPAKVDFSFTLANLLPGQTVVYRARVQNELGRHTGGTHQFTTRRPPSVVNYAGLATVGELVDGEPAETRLTAFDTPVFMDGTVAFRGTLRQFPGKPVQAILAGTPAQVLVRAGAEAGAPGVTFASFGEPLLTDDGFAFSAKLKGVAGSAGLVDSIWRYDFGPEGTGVLRLALMVGDIAPDLSGELTTSRVGSILSFSLRGRELIALVKYRLGGEVTAANDVVLLRLPGSEVGPQLLLREGQRLPGLDGDKPIISKIGVFTPAASAPGQGRSHVEGAVAVQVTLPDQRVFNFLINSNGSMDELLSVPGDAQVLGLPAVGAPDFVAFRANLNAPVATDEAVMASVRAELAEVIAREATTAVINADGAKLGSVGDVAANDASKVAFLGKLRQRKALCVVNEGTLFDIARVGAAVPDLPDIIYRDITRFALPDGADAGPLWIATLAGLPGVPVTSANNKALLAQDSGGVPRLLLRTGDPLSVGGQTRTIRSFEALGSGSFPIGGRRTIGTAGSVVARVVFTSGPTAIVKMTYP